MRQIISSQLQLGEAAIGDIQVNLKFRDDIPQILWGLQIICATSELREDVFKILEGVVPKEAMALRSIPRKLI